MPGCKAPDCDVLGYNTSVAAPPQSKPVVGDGDQHRHSVYAAESTGLLVIAVLLLILCLIRYWQFIPWGAR